MAARGSAAAAGSGSPSRRRGYQCPGSRSGCRGCSGVRYARCALLTRAGVAQRKLWARVGDCWSRVLCRKVGAGLQSLGFAESGLCSVNVNVNVKNLLAISISDFDNSGEPGPQAKGVNHLETPLRQLHVTHRASSCAKRGGHVQLHSKPRGGTRNRTRDLPKKGSAFITSSDHWTNRHWVYGCALGRGTRVEDMPRQGSVKALAVFGRWHSLYDAVHSCFCLVCRTEDGTAVRK